MFYVDPTRDSFKVLAQMPIEGPVHMLNLIKLKATATYADGRKATGAEAYANYGQASGPIFQSLGGKIIWRGHPKHPLIGPEDETWDIGFVAAYPDKSAFLSMLKNPDYQAIVFHRQAAVQTSRLYVFAGQASGDTFG